MKPVKKLRQKAFGMAFKNQTRRIEYVFEPYNKYTAGLLTENIKWRTK